ncbi:MAG: pirin family protein [Sediminibacterium sp.]|nr:pirin family protein [Sediminibacterium sp.]
MNTSLPRRNFLSRVGLVIGSAIATPVIHLSQTLKKTMSENTPMNPVKSITPLGFQWETADPFLFCVHHEDKFPKGNPLMGPDTSFLKGRHMGDDFIIKDGFRMYHGKTVPGFPGHPHRGFETITVVRQGYVDHADSMGAAGRYGNGDVQWMTAGKGVQHSEMFPLLSAENENPMELFQIWLNLPKKNKMVSPHFKMLWREAIPNLHIKDKTGKTTRIELIAGSINEHKAPTPPPDSWAADERNQVMVLNLKMDAGAEWLLPKTEQGINRTLYFYEGEELSVSGTAVSRYSGVSVEPAVDLLLKAGKTDVSILVLQGRPINEPVIQYGPFVMNTKEEINQAFEDYHKTQFGGWPWPKYDQVHERGKTRFARHADGKEEVKPA